jgi:hypothetical protein
MVRRYRYFVRTKRRYRFVTLMQEVCGSWAGPKRLVTVCSGERSVTVGRVALLHWGTRKRGMQTNGDAVMLWVMLRRGLTAEKSFAKRRQRRRDSVAT